MDKYQKLFCDLSTFKADKELEGVIKGVAMQSGSPDDGRSIVFSKKSVKANVGLEVPLFINHKSNDVTSMVGKATFNVMDGDNLMVTARLNLKDDKVKNQIVPLIEMGTLKGFSVGVRIDEFTEEDEKFTVDKMTIQELSIVTFPAFSDAEISEIFSSIRDVEKTLTNKGFSNNEAKKIISFIKNDKEQQRDVADIAADRDDLQKTLNEIANVLNEFSNEVKK